MARFICVESTIADLHTVGKKYQKMIDWCIRVIEAQPVVDVAPVRRGRWETKDGWDGDEYYACSSCGAEFVLIDGTPSDNDYNYCPNCGAKMDGGTGKGEEQK